jgi:hypothetical protein
VRTGSADSSAPQRSGRSNRRGAARRRGPGYRLSVYREIGGSSTVLDPFGSVRNPAPSQRPNLLSQPGPRPACTAGEGSGRGDGEGSDDGGGTPFGEGDRGRCYFAPDPFPSTASRDVASPRSAVRRGGCRQKRIRTVSSSA